MLTSDWVFFGFVIITAILMIVVTVMDVRLNNKRLKKEVEKRASEENKEFLLSHLFLQKQAGVRAYLPLLGTVLSVGLILSIPFIESPGLKTLYGGLFLMSWIFHITVIFVSLAFFISRAFKFYWFDERTSLMVSDFMTKEQVDLLFVKLKTDEKHNVLILYSEEVHLPDLMVKFLQRKVEINEYIELHKMDGYTSNNRDHMTEEQRARRRVILTEYYKSLETLKPVVTDILNATSRDFYVCVVEDLINRQVNKQEIQQEIEDVQIDFEQRLMKLNQDVGFRERHQNANAQIPEAIRELQRVAQSEQVSVEKKVEATELIQLIIEKSAIEKSEHEKEMVEMDAESVIKASKLFYGIDATMPAREPANV